jgi:hypothetical protein
MILTNKSYIWINYVKYELTRFEFKSNNDIEYNLPKSSTLTVILDLDINDFEKISKMFNPFNNNNIIINFTGDTYYFINNCGIILNNFLSNGDQSNMKIIELNLTIGYTKIEEVIDENFDIRKYMLENI